MVLMPIFEARKAELLPMSREIGLGLQTVNVIRGLRSDYERGWVFVPQEMLNEAGIDRDQFFLSLNMKTVRWMWSTN